MLKCECKREKFGPKNVLASLVVGSHCLYPGVTKIWILHQLFKIFQERITMHVELVYWVSTYFNPASARMITAIAEANLKIHFRVGLPILGSMPCVLQCSWEGRFFPLQWWWLGCQVSGAVTCCFHMSNKVQGVVFQLYSEIPLAGIPAQHSDWVWEKDKCCAWNVGILI